MLKKVSLAAFAAVAMLASCITNPGEKPVDYSTPGDPRVISLSIDNFQPSTRAGVDDVLDDDDAVINDFIVFIVRGDDHTFDVSPKAYSGTALSAGGDLAAFKATDKASKIYIVANTGTYATGPFAGLTNMTQVKSTAIAIDDPNHGCSAGDVWMSGSATLVDNGNTEVVGSETLDALEATLTLEFVPAKIYIQVDNQMKNYSAVGKTYIEGVSIINGGGYGLMFGPGVRADYGNVRYYYNGLDISAVNPYKDEPGQYNSTRDFIHKAAYSRTTNMFTTGNFHTVAWPAKSGSTFTRPDNTTGTYTEMHPIADNSGFYVMPAIVGNTEGTKVWATVFGKHNNNISAGDTQGLSNAANYAAADDWYWSVAFGKTGGTFASPIVGGNKYIATITLVGDAGIGSGGTKVDPTDETFNAAVKLNIQTAAWNNMIDGNKIFE